MSLPLSRVPPATSVDPAADGAASNALEVCGLVVHADPRRMDEVTALLAAIHGVDVLSRTPDGLLVVTVSRRLREAEHGQTMSDTLARIDATDGVIRSSVAYRYAEPGTRRG